MSVSNKQLLNTHKNINMYNNRVLGETRIIIILLLIIIISAGTPLVSNSFHFRSYLVTRWVCAREDRHPCVKLQCWCL